MTMEEFGEINCAKNANSKATPEMMFKIKNKKIKNFRIR